MIDYLTVFWWPGFWMAAKNETHNGTLFLFQILALTVHKTQLTEDQTNHDDDGNDDDGNGDVAKQKVL